MRSTPINHPRWFEGLKIDTEGCSFFDEPVTADVSKFLREPVEGNATGILVAG